MADEQEKPRYLVTARKYRPQTFGDLVAQEHVAETLRNAILGDRLAHAYLFSGPRGVGKTTAARLVAKAVNCQTPLAERPDAEPCRTCEACISFEEGRALNVIEMDAASNNGVDDVRELRETVRIPPQGADKKVYILDEVHMFSAAAFNALLKTLEEPPPYALFVFATTEPQKVLPTILSRTQRFDFRRIQVPEIVGRLRAVCLAEGIEADEDSLVLIARKGDGALRDALSLFDQAISLCGMNLKIGPLREALGVVDEDVFFAVTERAQQSDRAGLITLIDGLVRRGYDLAEFVDGLGEHLRDLMVTRSTGDAGLVEGTDATRARYSEASRAWSEADLLHLLMLVERCASELRDSRQPRLVVELALVKMATLERAASMDLLLDRLGRIEAALAGGATLPAGPASGAPSAPALPPATPTRTAPPAASGAPSSQPAASALAPAAPASGASPGPPPTPATNAALTPAPALQKPTPAPAVPPEARPSSPAPETPRPTATAEPSESYSSQASGETRPPQPPAQEARTVSAAPEAAAQPTPQATPQPRPAPESPSAPEARDPRPAPPPYGGDDRSSGDRNSGDGGVPTPPPSRPTPPVSPAPALPRPTPPSGGSLFGTPALRPRSTSGDGASGPASLAVPGDALAPEDPHFGISIPRVTEVWPQFVSQVRAERGPRLFSMIASAKPQRVHRGALEIGVPNSLAQSQLDAESEFLSASLADLAGQPTPLRFVVARSEQKETARADDPFETLKQLRQTDPVVQALFEKLGAEIVWN